MKAVFLWMSFVFLNFSLFFSKRVCASLIFLPEGGSKSLKVFSSQDIYVSNGKVIKVKDFGGTILVFAHKKGFSHIVNGDVKYKIQVLDKTNYLILRRIQFNLRKFMGLKVKMEDSRVIVYGELLRFSDWKALSKTVLSVKPDQKKKPLYFFRASFGADVEKKVREFFSKEMFRLGRAWSESNLNLKNYSVELSEEEKKRDHDFWAQMFHSYGLSLRFSKQKIFLSPMVRVQIYIAEISKSWQRQSGFKWPESLKAHIFPLSLSRENLFVQLQALENKGEGQILASPNLICRSGSKASFLAGGEFPIKTSGYRGGKVVWKPHGVMLEIKPLAESHGNMKIELSAEVSLIDNAHSVDGVPALKTNRIFSHFNLKKKTTLALSGLILQDFGHSSDQTPGFSYIPLLGRLFQSKSFKEQKSELVIFVTPEVL